MDLLTLGSLLVIGLVAGTMAGLLGIGGGIVIIPLLLYIAMLDPKLAMGISMVQAFFATVSGLVVHKKNRTVNVRLGVILGVAGLTGGLLGSFGSASIDGRVLLTVYLGLVLFSILLLFFAPKLEKDEMPKISTPIASLLGLGVGVLAGMLGVGGGFIMTPLMISVLKIPTRIAVGTSLLMILPTTFAGSIGKIATGQFDFWIALVVIVGSITGAQIGGRLNARVQPKQIRATLTVVLIAIVLRTGYDLLFG